MNKVLSFGEILLRLSPDVNGQWIDSATMPAYIGGAELNVAQALARWQIPVAYLSAMPENYMTARIREHLTSNDIDMSRTIWSGDRIGIYYLAQGTDLKHAEVIYDRAGSSTAMLQPGSIDWENVLRDVGWFHFSAISPAINANLALICKEALQAASGKGITISVDLNYRAKLWKWGRKPVEVMPELVSYCDVVMGNIWAAETMLGVEFSKEFADEKNAYVDIAQNSSSAVAKQFSKCKQVAYTFRFDRGDHLQYYGTYAKDGQMYVSKEHTVRNIVDKVGSGDCFMAGLIYGNLKRLSGQELIDHAAAAAVKKMGIMGDAIKI
jgi:2-dehydro-3-deoxygluconokinase